MKYCLCFLSKVCRVSLISAVCQVAVSAFAVESVTGVERGCRLRHWILQSTLLFTGGISCIPAAKMRERSMRVARTAPPIDRIRTNGVSPHRTLPLPLPTNLCISPRPGSSSNHLPALSSGCRKLNSTRESVSAESSFHTASARNSPPDQDRKEKRKGLTVRN